MLLRSLVLVHHVRHDRQTALHDGNTLTSEHRFVNDGAACQKDQVTGQAHSFRDLNDVARHQLRAIDFADALSSFEKLDSALVTRHLADVFPVSDRLNQGDCEGGGRNDQNAGCVVVVGFPKPEADAPDLENVERVEDFLYENAHDRLLGNVNLTGAILHPLDRSERLVSKPSLIVEPLSQLVIGHLTVEADGNEGVKDGLPLESDETVHEEDVQTFDRGVSFHRLSKKLVRRGSVVFFTDDLLVAV